MTLLTAVIQHADDGSEIFSSFPCHRFSEGFNKLTHPCRDLHRKRWLANPVNMVMVMVTTVHQGATMYFARAGSDFLTFYSGVLFLSF